MKKLDLAYEYYLDVVEPYRYHPLCPLFATLSPELDLVLIESFFDGFYEDVADLLLEDPDDEVGIHSALAYIQEHTEKIVIISSTSGEVLMEFDFTEAFRNANAEEVLPAPSPEINYAFFYSF